MGQLAGYGLQPGPPLLWPWLETFGLPHYAGIPIVDQLYDIVPTLKSISGCLNSLRVVSPGDRR